MASIQQVTSILPVVRPFLSVSQLGAMASACRGEEREFFKARFLSLAAELAAMPVTYAQDGLGEQAIAHLHYFTAGSDWYITEKDADGGVEQAFGYAILNGDDECAELGYISISELVQCGAELDLHFTPTTLGKIKAKRGVAAAMADFNYVGSPMHY